MEQPLTEELFAQFSDLVYQTCGIHLSRGLATTLEVRLRTRLLAVGAATFDDYYRLVTAPEHADELTRLVDSIATHLTYFFREPEHFDYLDRVLIPDLLARKIEARSGRLRVWSAGCSTGEEPYSLAMCFLEHLRDPDRDRWDLRIVATDLSRPVLETAARGIYSEERLNRVPVALRHTYFEPAAGPGDETHFRVTSPLKRVMTFRRLNLLDDEWQLESSFDLVFCRNVMIYFERKTQQELVQKIAACLDPGGHLFVGHRESLTALEHPLEFVQASVYRKPA